MITNLWRRLKQLLPEPPLLIGTIESTSDFGARVEYPDGSFSTVRGTGTVGQKVFVRNGMIEGPAPSLTVVLIEI